MKKAFALPEIEFPAWVKVGVVLQYPPYFLQGLFRMRHYVKRVGRDHHFEGLLCIGQAEHILYGKVQLCGLIVPPCFKDHLCRGVRSLDMRRRIHDALCDKPRAGGNLQHGFCFHHRPDQPIHLLIRRPVLSHEAVVPTGILVPEALAFVHGYRPQKVRDI